MREIQCVQNLQQLQQTVKPININVEFGDEKGQAPIDEIVRKAVEGRYNVK